MVGPVVHQEMLLGSRRNRLHILRWIYAGWLILQVFFFLLKFQAEQTTRRFNPFMPYEPESYASAPEVVGRWFTENFVSQQMILLLLATPAFVAGAITDEKRRGTLQYLLTTDLESRHIVLGKLLGRVAQVALLALAGLPLFCCLAGFAGISPIALLASLLVLIVPLFALGSATLLASVWCRQTRDAVLALYCVGLVGWLVVWFVGGPLRYLDPFYVLSPAWGPTQSADWQEMGQRLALSALCWGGLGALCLGLAVGRLRPAYIKELESIKPIGMGILGPARPPVDEEPIRWRERNVEGLAPMYAFRRVPRWMAVAIIFLMTVLSSSLILLAFLAPGRTPADVGKALLSLNPFEVAELFPDAESGFLVQSILVMLLASLVVGIRCSGTITGERERKTWESLLLTPITARELVRGKLWGVMGASHDYLLAYALPALPLSLLGGPLAFFFTLLGLGVTVLAMYFIGAAGLWCSVKSKNSWRSLLATLGLGYVGGFLIYLLTSPIIWVLAMLLLLVLYFIDAGLGTDMAQSATRSLGLYVTLFFIASGVGLAVIFLIMSRQFLAWTQRWIADRDRTRHWNDEPVYRQRKRVVTQPAEKRETPSATEH